MSNRIDPLLCEIALPLRGTYFPVGFPLQIATNSQDVLDAANESFGAWQCEFEVQPLVFRVVVQAEGELAPEPVFRKQGNLLAFVADAANFAMADASALTATIYVSAKTAADHAWFRWFFLEAMAYMLLTQRYVVSLHTACVASGEGAILLCGKSGSGKSTMAFACARAGFTYLADDCTWMLAGADDRIAIGKPHQVRFRHDAARHFPELAGYMASARPNGKLSMEVPTAIYPEVATARRAPVRALAFLDRESGGEARVVRMDAAEAESRILADMPSYGPEVNAEHERVVQSLACLPAYRVIYRDLGDGIRLLREI